MNIFTETKKRILGKYRYYRERVDEGTMHAKHKGLWEAVNDYHAMLGAGSLRKNWTKYALLYSVVRRRKPQEVLELGSGMSTVIIAYALMENERDGYASGTPRLTSMEESERYHHQNTKAFPVFLKKYADIRMSQKTENFYHLFRGVSYADVPARPYDLVFVDGPTTRAPSDGHKTFDADLLNVVARSEKPVLAIVDLRLSALWVYEQVFGRAKVRLGHGGAYGFVGPVTKKDMRTTNAIIGMHTFRTTFR
ncbi:MAG: hypothetical protein A3D67_04135 [Candidatus Lloydbacteria bacterium RIFCSPHIGHO2_02_FULL_51_22]|uniref:Class I SAM-dependent methyltransferase n=3 Tax=Candidatus Lloydiibacteriota TaxID=1817910 RepID=A0A1G2DFY3_9BACT|nr:MAG: hypothetical protein A3D67_04135 [Candidatus Lloydbacteria bacterium RIFCSPHIGHO2_02_FULL_51_22]OGZ15135.1 MAG: hypothetical protein A3J08_02630 [Candidatus Lloydbacteria bacterium RIFCSPLOWO2_02_FULL_51_11]OGZ17212.1 MAG: hypothetical protein A3G11_02150 [Candidatus Lloydbacteria bacterium RIFCSPLOWO2_12_FULL_51_9]